MLRVRAAELARRAIAILCVLASVVCAHVAANGLLFDRWTVSPPARGSCSPGSDEDRIGGGRGSNGIAAGMRRSAVPDPEQPSARQPGPALVEEFAALSPHPRRVSRLPNIGGGWTCSPSPTAAASAEQPVAFLTATPRRRRPSVHRLPRARRRVPERMRLARPHRVQSVDGRRDPLVTPASGYAPEGVGPGHHRHRHLGRTDPAHPLRADRRAKAADKDALGLLARRHRRHPRQRRAGRRPFRRPRPLSEPGRLDRPVRRSCCCAAMEDAASSASRRQG